jgi:hypothetical protein
MNIATGNYDFTQSFNEASRSLTITLQSPILIVALPINALLTDRDFDPQRPNILAVILAVVKHLAAIFAD